MGGAISAISKVLKANPIVGIALSLGLNFGLGALSGSKPKDFTTGSVAGQSPRYELDGFSNVRSNMVPVPLIYTEDGLRVSTQEIWNSGQGQTQKRLIGVGMGELGSLADVELNGKPITDFSSSVSIYTGTSSQAIDSRYDVSPNKIGGLRDTAYLALTLIAEEKLTGDPVITVNVEKGRKIARWNSSDWTTLAAAASGNPAAVIRDYLLLNRDRGGVGLSAAEVDDASFGVVYDWAEVMVDNGDGGTEPRARVSYTIDVFRPWPDVLHDLLISFGGFFTTDGRVLKLNVEKAESVVQAFEPGKLTGTIIADTFDCFALSKQSRPNRVVAIYIDPTDDGNDARVRTPPIDDYADQQTNPRGVVSRDIPMLAISRQSQAIREMTKNMNDARVNWYGVKFRSDTDSVKCEPGDVIKIKHRTLGDGATWHEVRVQKIDEYPNHERLLTCKAYNSSIFNDNLEVDPVTLNYSKITNPFDATDEVTGLAIAETAGFVNQDGTYFVKINATFTKPNQTNNLVRYRVLIKEAAGSYEFLKYISKMETSFDVGFTVEVGETYTIKVQTENEKHVLSDGAESNALVISGKDFNPSAVTGYTVVMDGSKLRHRWNAIADADLFGYKILEGPTQATSIQITEDFLGGTEYVDDKFTNGNKTFWIIAVDNSGNESTATSFTLNVTNADSNIVFNFATDMANDIASMTNAMVEYITVSGYPRMTPSIAIDTVRQWDDVTDFEGVDYNFPVVSGVADFTTKDFDIGGIGTGMISLALGATSVGSINFLIEINTSDDGAAWNGWQVFATGNYTCRYFKFKITFSSNDVAAATVNIYRLNPTFDVDDVVEEKTVTITNASTGLAVTYDAAFSGTPKQNDGTLELFDADDTKYLVGKGFSMTSSGFTLKAVNAETGSLDTGDIRYKARSYILT